MASSLVKMDFHLVFHVKSTAVPMRTADLPQIFSYIAGIMRSAGSQVITVGGVEDHIHALAGLPKGMSIVDFVRTVKSSSSKWIKTLDPFYEKFVWQDGYGAFSICPSVLDKAIAYVGNQAEHHKRRTFADEYRKLLEHYGVQYDEQFAFAD